MNFEKAQNLVVLNRHLIGCKIIGATIDEIIIYPTNQKSYDEFTKIYLRILNGEEAILPFKNEDVDVFCTVDKWRIEKNGVLGHASLQKVNEENEVFFE